MLNMIRSVRTVFLRSAVLTLALVMLLAALPTDALAAYSMPYYIEVDITNQIVTIYNTADGSVARQMLTSTGANGATPLGTYKLYGKVKENERSEWMYLGRYNAWVHYVTRISGPYLFHSFPYDEKDESTIQQDAVDTFGTASSHGCMRLRTEDAKFIAEKCMRGTVVKIYESGVVDESLRSLLMESSYTGENGMTYAEFQGISGDELGRGSDGDAVTDLQQRLGDLGYYEGEPDGNYDSKTATAVAAAQEDMGLNVTGACTNELYEILFAEDAPISDENVTVEEGRSGPVVKKIQQALHEIGLYDGDMDGIYDIDVIEAAKRFQSACGYTADGTLTPEMQQALYYTAAQLEALFGEENIPEPEQIDEGYTMATVSAPTKIIVRAKTSTSSKELGKVSDGDTVMVLDTDGKWAKIYVSGTTGYMYTKYLETYTEYNTILKYSSGETEYSIGHTIEEYAAGAKRFATEFKSIDTAVQETILIATVNTGSDDVMLNLRAEASSEAEVLAQVPNGTELSIVEQGDEWTNATYENITGYLMSEYLLFSESTADSTSATVIPVRVAADSGAGAKVYAEASRDSELLGKLKNGIELSAIDAVGDSWIRIRYEGKEGYMLKSDLERID